MVAYLGDPMLSNTRPFIDELERALPSRPFSVEFWDGARLASTNGGGPTFSVRSPQAIAHVLRAPGQLGLGRAYVSGELTVDDLDEVLELLDSWEPPPLDRRAQARLALGALRASGLIRPPAVPKAELRPRGRRHSIERDAPRGAPPLRRLERLLPADARRVDDLQLRPVLAGGDDARGGPGGEARAGLQEARAQAGPARARRGLRLGQLRDARRRQPRRPRGGHHALGAAGGARAPARRGARARRQGGHPGDGLPRAGGRALRRGGEHRHGRARGLEPDRRLRAAGRAAREARRARAQPRHRPAAGGRPRGGTVLGALRVPRRRAAPPLPHPARARTRRAGDRARGGAAHGLRRDAAQLGGQHRREPRRGDPPRGARAHPRLAALPARGAARLRERLHLGLPGALLRRPSG